MKGAQDAAFRGERDALSAMHSGPTVSLKLNDGTSSQYRYIRRIGDKIIVAPTASSSQLTDKYIIALLRRSDVASITSSVDASSELAKFNNEVKAATWRPIIYLGPEY
jgi:hypothetical protein